MGALIDIVPAEHAGDLARISFRFLQGTTSGSAALMAFTTCAKAELNAAAPDVEDHDLELDGFGKGRLHRAEQNARPKANTEPETGACNPPA